MRFFMRGKKLWVNEFNCDNKKNKNNILGMVKLKLNEPKKFRGK